MLRLPADDKRPHTGPFSFVARREIQRGVKPWRSR